MGALLMCAGRPLSASAVAVRAAYTIECVTKIMLGVRACAPDAQQLELQDLARLGVDRRKWLIHQRHIRLDRQCASEPAALLHAA